jgi:hypothetical protein
MPVSRNRKKRGTEKWPHVDTKGSDIKGRFQTHFAMAISYVGDGELEGIVDAKSVNVVVHAGNRATLVRKAKRELTEKHGFVCPVINLPKPSVRIEGVVL